MILGHGLFLFYFGHHLEDKPNMRWTKNLRMLNANDIIGFEWHTR
jgi:hypothetical protein